jgi:hypothetical protein
MMEDANDPDGVAIDIIEDMMAAVRQATDRWIDLGAQRPRQGMPPKQIECRIEAPEIGFGLLSTELSEAVLKDAFEIGLRRCPQSDLSHAGPR